jgi:LuxR family transcriptional regulator, maltose regulon positive regulatory protein
MRLFIDAGEPLRRLLADRAQAADLPAALRPYVRRVLAAFAAPVHAAPVARAGGLGLVEPLSARELEVLRLLAEGHSNRAIAEALVISVGTVKSHLNRILGKLAAHSRTQAVAHARTLGLV